MDVSYFSWGNKLNDKYYRIEILQVVFFQLIKFIVIKIKDVIRKNASIDLNKIVFLFIMTNNIYEWIPLSV